MKPVNQNTAALDGQRAPKKGHASPDVPNRSGTVPERVRHLKTGGEYEVLGEAEVQLSKPTQGVFSVAACRPVREGERLTVYRGKDGQLWGRFTDEFRDGRFETITPEASENPARLAQALEAVADRSPPSRATTYRRLAAVLRQPGFGEARHG